MAEPETIQTLLALKHVLMLEGVKEPMEQFRICLEREWIRTATEEEEAEAREAGINRTGETGYMITDEGHAVAQEHVRG